MMTKADSMTAKDESKTEFQALYAAMNIHRKANILAAMWIAFDPFGAVVYELQDLLDETLKLREEIMSRKPDWDFTKATYYPIRPIKEGDGGNHYGTFKNHIKSIQGILRRFLRNPWVKEQMGEDKYIGAIVDLIQNSLKGLRQNM